MTPQFASFLGTIVTAADRGVPLGDLLDSIHDHLQGGWTTWDELDVWAGHVTGLEPRVDVPSDSWLANCTLNGLDPVIGLPHTTA